MPVTAVPDRRSTADVVLGLVLVLAGVVVLGNAALTTLLTVQLLGWTTLAAGTLLLVGYLRRRGTPEPAVSLLGAALLIALGLVMLTDPEGTAVGITLLAGAMLLATGLVRTAAALRGDGTRWPSLLGGAVPLVLGVLVLANLVPASLTLLGVVIGVQLVLDGLLVVALGRPRTAPAGGATVGRGPGGAVAGRQAAAT